MVTTFCPSAPARRLAWRGALLPLAALLAAPLSLLSSPPVRAQQSGYGQTMGGTTMEQQIYDAGGGSRSGSSSLLNTTNPMDLMNKIRKGTALDDATPPVSAIDQALKELNAQPAPSVSATPQGMVHPAGSHPASSPALPQPVTLKSTPVTRQAP